MKKSILLFLSVETLAIVLAFVVVPRIDAHAQRVDSFTQASDVTCQSLAILPLPDGGAEAAAMGIATSDDGGTTISVTASAELTGARQTNALNMLNGPCINLLLCGSRIQADAGTL